MKYLQFQTQVYFLLLAFFFFTSCNGQVKSNLPIDKLKTLTTLTENHPKLIKTQGSGKFDKQFEILGCALQDKTGNIWFGTSNEGVYRYNGKSFTQYTMKDGLCSNDISCILEDKAGNLWFGSSEQMCRYNPSTQLRAGGKIFTSIPIPPARPNVNHIKYENFPSDSPPENNKIWSMMLDRSGKIWLGTTDGVYCYNPLSQITSTSLSGSWAGEKAFTRFLDNDSIINKENVHLKWTQCMLEDKNGNIWFGSWVYGNEGICRYDGKSISQYKPYGEGWIRTIIEDKNGDILFATRHKGVCRYNGKTFVNFTEEGGIDNASINTILEDKKGNLWFATELGSGQLGEDGGLWRYSDGNFTRFTTNDGLIHNGIYMILEDKDGNIWIGTRNTGLSRYDGKNFTSFSE